MHSQAPRYQKVTKETKTFQPQKKPNGKPRRQQYQRGPRGAPRGRGSGRPKGNRQSYVEALARQARSPLRSAMPVSVSSKSFTTYHKSVGRPVHKEWGPGVRFSGCSVLGQLSVNTSNNVIYSPGYSQYGSTTTPVSGTVYFDLYTAVIPAYASRVMSLHPYFVTRLNQETHNWGRYAYRSITLHSAPVSNTTEPIGYTVGMSHDVSWPLLPDQEDNLSSLDIAQMGDSAVGAFFEPFLLTSRNFRGDRTWPTSVPTCFVATTSTDQPPASALQPHIEDSYQYFFSLLRSDSIASGFTPGFRGYVYITYEIDFYSIKSDNNSTQLAPILWNSGVTVTNPTLSKALRTIRPTKPKELKTRELQTDETTSRRIWDSGRPENLEPSPLKRSKPEEDLKYSLSSGVPATPSTHAEGLTPQFDGMAAISFRSFSPPPPPPKLVRS